MACNNYRLDMTAATFGMCQCGYPKIEHANPNPSFARPRGMSNSRAYCPPASAPAPASSSSDTIEERWDEQYQQTYYFNTVTGESGWSREEVEAAAAGSGAATGSSSAATSATGATGGESGTAVTAVTASTAAALATGACDRTRSCAKLTRTLSTHIT